MSAQPIKEDTMQLRNTSTVRAVASFFAAVLLLSNVAFAGPPLICHAFDIGGAKSLPWVSEGWNLTGSENYNTNNLAADSIAVLDSSSVVLVHMETLRRATLFARADRHAAKELLTRLVGRSDAAPSSTTGALAIFDAGYLAECYKQWLGDNASNPAFGFDGYALIEKAIQLRGNDAQLEFAAALAGLSGSPNIQQAHAQKALAGAKSDSLLAHNLFTHFLGAQSETMAEMISRNMNTKVARQ
jgi:hypothetical protein